MVIGAGVSGLTAAWRLQQQGVRVVVLEAGPRVGGQVSTTSFAGLPVELGAEGVHLAAPDTAALLNELDLLADVVEARSGGTWVDVRGTVRRLPAGVGPAGPTRLWPVVRSGVLSPSGLARAALEPALAGRRVTDDVAVADFVAARFGRQVVDRLVDPLLGGIHAGDVHRLSLRACAPQLVDAAERGRSLSLAGRRPRHPAPGAAPGAPLTPPALVSWPRGLTTLVSALEHRLDEPVRLGCRVASLARDPSGAGYRVGLATGEVLPADAVVVAVPARAASSLITGLHPAAATALAEIRSASVATVLAEMPHSRSTDHAALRGTGLLVPSGSGRLLRAATFVTAKWPHLAAADRRVVRLSAGRSGEHVVGRLSDAELVGALLGDLGELLDRPLTPVATLVQRWPDSMAQLEIGHRDRLASVRRALRAQPGLALAGASYDGLGLAACLRSGEQAAHELLDAAGPRSQRREETA